MSSRDKIQVKQVSLTTQGMRMAMKNASDKAKTLVVWQVPKSAGKIQKKAK